MHDPLPRRLQNLPARRNEITALAGVSLGNPRGLVCRDHGAERFGEKHVAAFDRRLGTAERGELLVDGRLIGQMADDQVTLFRRKQIGFVFQFFNLLPTLTALENIALPLVLDGRPKSKRMGARRQLLAKVGLDKRKDHLPKNFPAERSSVSLSRAALSFSPPILFADEPTGNLDSKNGRGDLSLSAPDQPRRRLYRRDGHP